MVGSLRPRPAAADQTPVALEEITADGRQITVLMNGQNTVELHNGLFAEGPVGLQHGAGVIKFRKVAIKPL
jgi:Domain of Unknown Function (DUF1080)